MDKAQRADREALFAALQAAVSRLIDTMTSRGVDAVYRDLDEVERRLDLGHPYGWEFQ
jgi:hypothetical protein